MDLDHVQISLHNLCITIEYEDQYNLSEVNDCMRGITQTVMSVCTTSDVSVGVLHSLCRKTQVGNVEINDIRPPRFIGRDGVRLAKLTNLLRT